MLGWRAERRRKLSQVMQCFFVCSQKASLTGAWEGAVSGRIMSLGQKEALGGQPWCYYTFLCVNTVASHLALTDRMPAFC